MMYNTSTVRVLTEHQPEKWAPWIQQREEKLAPQSTHDTDEVDSYHIPQQMRYFSRHNCAHVVLRLHDYLA